MNIHSLAKTTPAQRREMVRMVREEQRTVEEAAQRFVVTVRTVYKWLARFRDEGPAGLQDRSSRPRSSPRQLEQEVVDRLSALRRELWLRVVELAGELKLAQSTVSAWLRRLGLNRRPPEPREPVQRYEHASPGALVHFDIKKLGRIEAAGHAVTGDRSKRSRGAGWEYMHVCVDDHSRYAYTELLPDEKATSTVAFLRRAVAHFQQRGVKIVAALSDNGSCYRSKHYRKACAELDIRQRFTRPYRPQTNGKAERFIRTLLDECLRRHTYNHSSERCEALKSYCSRYNSTRPHSAIGHLPPTSRLPALNNLFGGHN